MKNAIVLSLLLTGLTLGCTKDPIAPAELSNNPLTTQLDKEVDTVVKKYRQSLNTVGLSIGIWKNGATHIYGYGEIRKGSQQVPDARTFFEVGSITKTFTATAMQQWLTEKGLSVESPIQSFLPASIPSLEQGGIKISFKQLLNHSSGLAYFPDNLDLSLNSEAQALATYSETKLFDYLKKGKLNAVPGTTYEYSNTAFGLAGTILARENQQTYGDYLYAKVCQPLGLDETKAQLSAEEKTRMADAHKGSKKVDLWESLGALDGAGVLRSTTADLLKYGVAVLNPPNTALGQAMRACQVPTFKDAVNFGESVEVGLGWIKAKLADGSGDILVHDGGTGGFNSFLIVDQSKNLVLVLWYNSHNGANQAEAKARAALNNDLLLLLR